MEGASSVRYRAATDDDVAAIQAIARLCWETDYPDIVTRETIRTAVLEWYDEASLRADVNSGDAVVTVAEADGAVCGFAHALWDEGVGIVLRLYVAPDFRDAGVGTALLDATAEELRSRGADTLRAMVLAANAPGNEFYRAAGFERVDDGVTIIGGGEYDENVYERALDAE